MWEGRAPRQNACLAPGLWQHIDISFQAPRFDAAGKKIANAKYLKIVLNGVLIHENVELTGPTGGPISEEEAPTGPFMIQGDHGPVAFRNFIVSKFGENQAKLTDIGYKVWYGKYKTPAEFLEKTPDTEGVSEKLSWDFSNNANDFAEVLTSKIRIPEAGKYKITIQFAGRNSLKINNIDVLPEAFGYTTTQRSATVDLAAGELPFVFTGYKTDGWLKPILGIWIEGAAFRKTPLHNFTSTVAGTPADPILLEADKPRVFRSFMDIEKKGATKKRIVQAVSVGSPSKVHYTYNLENGAIAQIWKGDFLNTSPMWDDRGDGSSKPRGAVLLLNNTPLVSTEGVAKVATDTVPEGANFKTLGYDIDENNVPIFRYRAYGAEFEDQIRVTDDRYLTRTLSTKTTVQNLTSRLAIAKEIVKISPDTYAVDGKSYYIKLSNGVVANIEKAGDQSVLVAKFNEKLTYSVLW